MSEVRLLKGVPLSKDTNVLSFKGTTPYSYFNSKVYKTFNEVLYVRKDLGSVQLEIPEQEVSSQGINYLMFSNNNGDSWTYCFIDSYEYVNERSTRFTFTVDVWSTYFKDISVTGLVEREHANYNQINTLSEDIELNDPVVTSKTPLTSNNTNVKFAIITTTTDLTNPQGYNGGTAGVNKGIDQPYSYYILNASSETLYLSSSTVIPVMALSQFNMFYANNEDLANKIVSIKIVKELPFPFTLTRTEYGENDFRYVLSSSVVNLLNHHIIETVHTIISVNYSTGYSEDKTYPIAKPFTHDSSKLNYYPYSYLELNTGTSKLEIRKENLGSNLTIRKYTTLEAQMTDGYEVLDYKGDIVNNNSVTVDNGVSIPVVTESIASFLQSRENSVLEGTLTGVGMLGVTMALGAATGGIGAVAGVGALSTFSGEMIKGSAMGLGQTVGGLPGNMISEYMALKQQKKLPNDISGSMGKLVGLTMDIKPYLLHYQIKEEYAQIASEFFKKFGWKTMRLKTPNLTTRNKFNFVKMQDVVITGNVSHSVKARLSEYFINGVTLWHDPTTIGNYNQANTL